MNRATSPCPCKSPECIEEWKNDMVINNTVLKTIGNTVATGPLDRFRFRGRVNSDTVLKNLTKA